MSVHAGHRERMRNRFVMEGLDSFADHEVLELLLYAAYAQGDTNPLAHALIDAFGSLRAVLEATPDMLMKVEGVGLQTAAMIGMLVPMFRRYQMTLAMDQPFLFRAEMATLYCKGLLSGLRNEYLYALFLSASGKLVGQQLLAKGNPSEVWTYPRKVVEAALRANAQHVILCHNHPGGNATPSRQDVEVTHHLQKTLQAVEIQLQDHIIVGDDETYSMALRGDLS